MAAAGWSTAPALIALRDEINRRWPDRLKSTDGFIGDAAHHGGVKPGQKPSGEHVPTDANGYYRTDGVVRAGDYDVRLPGGKQFGDELVKLLIEDGKRNQRIGYIIYRGKIYSRTHGWVARSNSGHDHWVHVSLRNNVSQSAPVATVNAAAADVSPFFPKLPKEELNMAWPSCMPYKKGQWLKVSTAAGLTARFGPGLGADKKTVVPAGYRIKVQAAAHVDDMWWVRGATYWYAVASAEGKPYVEKD